MRDRVRTFRLFTASAQEGGSGRCLTGVPALVRMGEGPPTRLFAVWEGPHRGIRRWGTLSPAGGEREGDREG
jgi:hypothetical protein